MGFVKNIDGNVVVANRIFESLLYNLFLAEESIESKIYDVGSQEKNQFIINGHLNMKLVLEKFGLHFNEIYGGSKDSFLEETGRRYFLLYLKHSSSAPQSRIPPAGIFSDCYCGTLPSPLPVPVSKTGKGDGFSLHESNV